MLDELEIFIERLKKININLNLSANYPWIYIDSINGIKVKEKQYSDYAWTIGFYPIRRDENFKFYNLDETFKLIKKYITL